MLDALLDAVIDTAKLFPILWITYILMEWLEHRAKDKTLNLIRYSGKAGPLFGGLLGIIPQCGFSGAAASFFASHSITMGSLIAIFLATSDEMLPILISSNMDKPYDGFAHCQSSHYNADLQVFYMQKYHHCLLQKDIVFLTYQIVLVKYPFKVLATISLARNVSVNCIRRALKKQNIIHAISFSVGDGAAAVPYC